MIFSEEPYILHLLAGSDSITSLDAVKGLLDSGAHNVNEREQTDNLSALHVAAAWDRLAMCQLLVHYGADLNAVDIDKRRPVDVATGKSRRFLRKFEKRSTRERNKLRKIISFLFRRICVTTNTKDESMIAFAKPSASVIRRSCPALYSPESSNQKPSDVDVPANEVEERQPNAEEPQLNSDSLPPSPDSIVEVIRQPSDVYSRPSTIDREFFTLDNTWEVVEPSLTDHHSEEGDRGKLEDIAKKEDELRQQFSNLDIGALKNLLKEKNLQIGPMDAISRKLYEGKLAKLEVSKDYAKQNSASINQYSVTLRRMILNSENGISTDGTGLVEDRAIREEYANSVPKNEVSFFCYLLIDPTLIPTANNSDVTFIKFISAIFYVGKGKRSRPLQHLIHASKCRSLINDNPTQRSEKLKRIMDLWDRGEGVISLNLFTNIHSGEAFVREGSMIEAIGLDNLTNLQRGTFPGPAAKWTRQEMAEFGALLLKKAHVIFKNERCRPIFEADVAGIV